MVCYEFSAERYSDLLRQYNEIKKLIEARDLDTLSELYYKFDLFEACISEMRIRLLHELNIIKKEQITP